MQRVSVVLLTTYRREHAAHVDDARLSHWWWAWRLHDDKAHSINEMPVNTLLELDDST